MLGSLISRDSFVLRNSPLISLLPEREFHKMQMEGSETKWLETEALIINALLACVYIYIRQLSSFRALRCGLSI